MKIIKIFFSLFFCFSASSLLHAYNYTFVNQLTHRIFVNVSFENPTTTDINSAEFEIMPGRTHALNDQKMGITSIMATIYERPEAGIMARTWYPHGDIFRGSGTWLIYGPVMINEEENASNGDKQSAKKDKEAAKDKEAEEAKKKREPVYVIALDVT